MPELVVEAACLSRVSDLLAPPEAAFMLPSARQRRRVRQDNVSKPGSQFGSNRLEQDLQRRPRSARCRVVSVGLDDFDHRWREYTGSREKSGSASNKWMNLPTCARCRGSWAHRRPQLILLFYRQ